MRRGWWQGWWCVPLVALVGCASAPATLPTQMSQAPAECRWMLADTDRMTLTRTAVSVLESEGYRITHTNTQLGVVSAERSKVLPGYGVRYDDYWTRGSGVFGSIGGGVGAGGRIGVGSGVGIGVGVGSGRAGYGAGFPADAVRIERVSLVAPDERVVVSQDTRVIDAEGAVRESHGGGSAALCQAIEQAIERAAVPERPAVMEQES